MRLVYSIILAAAVLFYQQTNAQQVDSHLSDEVKKADSLLNYAESSNADPDDMIRIGNEVISDSINIDIAYKARAYNTIAYGYLKKNRYTTALENLNKAAEALASVSDSTELARTYNRIGVTYNRLGHYNRAIEHLQKALSIRKNIGNTLLVASTLNNLGVSQRATKQFDAALSSFSESSMLYDKNSSVRGKALSLNNIGLVLLDKAELDSALDYFKKSVELKKELNDTSGIAIGLFNIATVYEKLHRTPKAIEYFKDAISVQKSTQDLFGLASSYSSLAELCLKNNLPHKALAYIEKSQELADINESTEQALKNLRLLSDYYNAIENYKESRRILEEYAKGREEFFNEQTSTQIAELSFVYQNERQLQERKLIERELEVEQLKTQKSKLVQASLAVIVILLIFLLVISIFVARSFKQKNLAYSQVNTELNHINNHLENIVENRTSDLLDALQKAQESDKLKSTFLANMSHEVRTPLNGILGFSKLLLEEDISSNTRKMYIDIINRRSRGLLQIINDLINISMLDTGQVEVKTSAFNLNQLLYDLYSMFNSESYKKKNPNVELKLSVSLSDSRSNVITDPNRLEQILTNLLDNAIKFTSTGSVSFGYSIYQKKEVIFFVKDTGTGIPLRRRDKIFTRFNKEPDMLKNEAFGTGLGLPICKGLVELLNGKIWYESEEDKGTTFFFSIPYLPSKRKAEAYTSITSLSANKLDFENKTILVVEDDLISYQFVEALLHDSNAKLLHAKNGEDAIEICSIVPNINLVIMDMRLPFIDGYEATARIKEQRPNLPIIAQTANVMSNEKSRCFKAGCDEYIAKPIDPDEFLRVLAHYLKKPVLS
ncbi:MAG: tetratricopeptide repeat protein [Bacteroidales bacterium]